MSITETLIRYASDIDDVLEMRARHSKEERVSPLNRYRTKIGNDYQCPNCWLRHERQADLSSVPGTERADIMRCHECNSDYVIPLGG
jgi:hypothetical protein